MKTIIKNKGIIIVVLIALLVFVLLWDEIYIPSIVSNNIEDVAVVFTKAMLEGDADKCVDLMCDEFIDRGGYESKKLFTRAFQQTLDSILDDYKNEFGRHWKYSIAVIDTLDYSSFYEEYEMKKVVLQLDHKGGSIFTKKEGTEDIILIMAKVDGKWLVYDFPLY